MADRFYVAPSPSGVPVVVDSVRLIGYLVLGQKLAQGVADKANAEPSWPYRRRMRAQPLEELGVVPRGERRASPEVRFTAHEDTDGDPVIVDHATGLAYGFLAPRDGHALAVLWNADPTLAIGFKSEPVHKFGPLL